MFLNISQNIYGNIYGEPCRHLNIRVGEHSGVSPLTEKKAKAKTTTAIKDNMLFCDHAVSLHAVSS